MTEELTIWFIWVTVEYSIARQLDPLLLQDTIHFSSAKDKRKKV